MTSATVAQCTKCGKNTYVAPLHDDKGGPLMCPICAGMWHAEHSRRRKWGRIVIKAIKMYLREGGRYSDIDKLKMSASRFGIDWLKYGSVDTIGSEVGDITSELLADTIQLTHPDKHPSERRDLAKRVTQELLALKPFVFPAPKPRDTSFKSPPATVKEPSHGAGSSSRIDDAWKEIFSFPCEACADTVPYYYCDPCKAEWQKRQQKEREIERVKQREQYARRRQRILAYRRPVTCEGCGEQFKGKRKDALYCSAACRQRIHRKRNSVTDNKSTGGDTLNSRDEKARP